MTEDRGRRTEKGERNKWVPKLKVFETSTYINWQSSCNRKYFELTKRFPKEEIYSLTNQIRRASRSIGANISESWHKRRYPAHFLSKLSDADAEQAETQHWLDTSLKCKYITSQEHRALLDKCKSIGRMLGKMMGNPDVFCGKSDNK